MVLYKAKHCCMVSNHIITKLTVKKARHCLYENMIEFITTSLVTEILGQILDLDTEIIICEYNCWQDVTCVPMTSHILLFAYFL